MYITEESIKIHGITNEFALEKGECIEQVLNKLNADLKDVQIIISHNIIFHLRTLQGEFIRYNIPFNFDKIIIDTISFFHKFSYPKLKDLYEKLHNKSPKKKQNLELIKKCFFTLYNQYSETI